jgi:hypothetical protein
LFAIPIGGSRHKLEAYNLTRQGVKAGIPDICLPVARRGFHGLYIELKADKGKASEKQGEWIDKLLAEGYNAGICRGWKQAVDCILWYLGAAKTFEF